jgi:hypothetical protein
MEGLVVEFLVVDLNSRPFVGTALALHSLREPDSRSVDNFRGRISWHELLGAAKRPKNGP